MSRTDLGRLLRFGIVGTLGFAVDSLVLLTLLATTGMDPYIARLPAFVCAASFTWLVNRSWTFADARRDAPVGQWGRYVTAMTIGAVANYGTYVVVITAFAMAMAWPVLGVAAGSLAGMVVNYTLARRFIFREHRD